MVEPWLNNHGFRVITFLVSFAVKTAVKPDDVTMVEPRFDHGTATMVELWNDGRFYRSFYG